MKILNRLQWRSCLIIFFICFNCGFLSAENRDLFDSWHIPDQEFTSGITMRDPIYPDSGNVDLYLGGTPVDVIQSAIVNYKFDMGSWQQETMSEYTEIWSDEFWKASVNLPGSYTQVSYYFSITANGYDQTFVYGNNSESQTTGIESTAQNNAFSFFVGVSPTPTFPHTPVPTVTATPTQMVTPSPTPESPTATPTVSITGTATPSATPFPFTRTPTPGYGTSTPTPAMEYELDLVLNDTFFDPGEPFLLYTNIYNRSGMVLDTDLYVVLDVKGEYWFYPDWSQTLDYYTLTNIRPDSSQPFTWVILDFPWPEEEMPGMTGIIFHSAMFEPGSYRLLGNMDSEMFGY